MKIEEIQSEHEVYARMTLEESSRLRDAFYNQTDVSLPEFGEVNFKVTKFTIVSISEIWNDESNPPYLVILNLKQYTPRKVVTKWH